ncbi:hypothetical protein EI77_00116 [Prosthecobacter fusiformis]|uniref:Uncharacterized protein n=1 Tax=Prosthecobacter fusiformis TaxID=48464 RepID=A0A4R7SRM8_9BACT|nr:hypothetical protein [Prosthecobacter fusiformis]TDU80818.1 hypothetical protein EI77_00116 [Prosthecobacter fusiformis]
MNDYPHDLETTRGRIFFWIGMVIFPAFWIWWMRPRYFTKSQRLLGWIWFGVYLLGLLLQRELIGRFLPELVLGYPVIAVRLNLVLFVWFLVRCLGFQMFLMVAIVSVDVVAVISAIFVPSWNRLEEDMSPMRLLVFAPAFVLATMHLMLTPVRTWYKNLKAPGSETA